MKKTFYINFSAQGHFSQTVQMLKEGMTAKELAQGLNSGKFVTTIQERDDSYIEDLQSGEKIAIISNSDNHLEYDDFTVDEA